MLLLYEPPSTFGQGQAGTLGGIAYGNRTLAFFVQGSRVFERQLLTNEEAKTTISVGAAYGLKC